MRRLFSKVFGGSSPRPLPPRERLSSGQWPSVVYAIGDVHGCHDQLLALQKQIEADAADIPGEKWIVMLGDYVDRGPDSSGVLDTLMASPPAGFRRICLAGNHEVMMLDFIANPDPSSAWLQWGGFETLQSYGIASGMGDFESPTVLRAMLDRHVPAEHLDFLARLPVSLTIPGAAFVHAGIRPGIPMDQQHIDDLLWIREPFLETLGDPDFLIVHGHTAGPRPVVAEGRICVDTGAYRGGTLTAVCLQQDEQPRFLSAPAT